MNPDTTCHATLPAPGAHIITPRNRYEHHGIYVGNGRVVHYTGLCRNLHAGPIQEVTLAEFEADQGYRVAGSDASRFNATQIIARARSRIGENQYNLLQNNCEHFCTWCIYGEAFSKQVGRVMNVTMKAVCVIGLTSLLGGMTIFV